MPAVPYILRTHRPGDMGWVVHRHGDLYWREYGYDERFEALVARIVADFVQHFDSETRALLDCRKVWRNPGNSLPGKEIQDRVRSFGFCWSSLQPADLESAAAWSGNVVRFGREAGYKKMILWTQSELGAARHLYKEAGFRLAGQQRHNSWGRGNLISEVWELKL